MEIVYDVITAAISALLLEVSATPKPGNVHRYHDHEDVRYEHFLISSASMNKCLFKYSLKALINAFSNSLKDLGIGQFIYECVKYSKEWHSGGNTNLGTSTILSLEVPAVIFAKINYNIYDPHVISKYAIIIAKETDVEDAIYFYKAIRAVMPSYLGRISDAPIPDVFDKDFERKIKLDKITLWDVWKYSSQWDLVSKNCISGLKHVLEGYNHLVKFLEILKDWNLAVIASFLKLLSQYDDSLILRKHGVQVLDNVKSKAKHLLSGILEDPSSGIHMLKKFDDELHKNKINPGSIADILMGSIMLALLNNIRP